MNLSVLKKNFVFQFIEGVFFIISKIGFFTLFIFFSFFVLFNSSIFTSSSTQALLLRDSILYLFVFALSVLFVSYLSNPKLIKRDIFLAKGFTGVFSFVIAFIVFGVIFVSFESRLDTRFVYGLLNNGLYLFTYYFIVAFLEEIIFRIGVLDLFKSKTDSKLAYYFLSMLVFSLYHYFKYSGKSYALVFAFFSGGVFTYIKEVQEISGFPTFPIAIALHFVYDLFSVGALLIVLHFWGVA